MQATVPSTPVVARAPLLGPITTVVFVYRRYQPELAHALAIANGNETQTQFAWQTLRAVGDYLVLQHLSGSLTQKTADTLPGFADRTTRRVGVHSEVRFGFNPPAAALGDWQAFFERKDLFLWFETPGRFWKGGYVTPHLEMPISGKAATPVPLAVVLPWVAPSGPLVAIRPTAILDA